MIYYFDGPTAVGKTTQLRLFEKFLKKRNLESKIYTEHSIIRQFIENLPKENYYRKKIPIWSETLLWLSHYSMITEMILNDTNPNVLVDRSFLTPLVYQYLDLTAEGITIDFKNFQNLIKNIYDRIFPSDTRIIYYVFDADNKSIVSRFNNRENRDFSEKEYKVFSRSIELYRNIDMFSQNENTRLIRINTSGKCIEDIHNEVVSHEI